MNAIPLFPIPTTHKYRAPLHLRNWMADVQNAIPPINPTRFPFSCPNSHPNEIFEICHIPGHSYKSSELTLTVPRTRSNIKTIHRLSIADRQRIARSVPRPPRQSANVKIWLQKGLTGHQCGAAGTFGTIRRAYTWPGLRMMDEDGDEGSREWGLRRQIVGRWVWGEMSGKVRVHWGFVWFSGRMMVSFMWWWGGLLHALEYKGKLVCGCDWIKNLGRISHAFYWRNIVAGKFSSLHLGV